MGAHLVDPGSVLADRYVAEDLLAQDGESESWRARDRVLSRSVVIQIMPSSSQYAAELLSAAKLASRVTDTRVLQVLDAVDDGELTYVVREWATGDSLDVVLHQGPLPARRAAWLLREVAAAMANAHKLGLPHRRLVPEAVVLTKSSGVKLIGLGTAGALKGDPAAHADLELEDTRDLGRLLYACLTARWPGEQRSGLVEAPTEHGRLLRPRQVRAGVPRALDGVCDRILNPQSRYGPPITTVSELKDILGTVLSEEGFVATTGVGLQAPATPTSLPAHEPPPAILPRNGGSAPPSGALAAPPAESSSRSWRSAAAWAIVALLVVGAVLLGFLIGRHRTPSEPGRLSSSSTTNQSTPPASYRPIAVSQVTTLDPVGDGGSGDENPDLAALAVDQDPESAWTTQTYYDSADFNGEKPGVGLVLDLGKVQDVSLVRVTLLGQGTSVELRAASGSAQVPPPSGDAYQLLDRADDAGTTVSLAPDGAVSTRFVLVWLTSLPADGDDFRGGIADIEVRG